MVAHTCSSQIDTVASKLAQAKHVPSGDQLLLRMVRAWASCNTAVHSQRDDCLFLAQIRIDLSLLVLARRSPVGASTQ